MNDKITQTKAPWKDKVIGQRSIIDQLTQQVADDHLSHAIILEGASGYGSLPIAFTLSQRVLCANPQGVNACDSCKQCLQVKGLTHPDLHLAFPVVKKEGTERKNTTSKDFIATWRQQVLDNPYMTYNEWIRSISKTSANGDINVKECNDIIQQLSLQSYGGGQKVQLIWIADELGSNGNKLLNLFPFLFIWN